MPLWMLVILELGKWRQADPWSLRARFMESLSQNTRLEMVQLWLRG